MLLVVLVTLTLCALGSGAVRAQRPVAVHLLRPLPGTVARCKPRNGTRTLQIAFNQPVAATPAQRNVTLFADARAVWSQSVKGFAVQRPVGATVSVTLPVERALFDQPHTRYALRVDAGAFEASDGSGALSPLISEAEWHFECVRDWPAPASRVPAAVAHAAVVKPLNAQLRGPNVLAVVSKLASYYNRFYDSKDGAESREWLRAQYAALADASGRDDIVFVDYDVPFQLRPFEVRIVGSKPSLGAVMVGGHLDTINRTNWTINARTGRAPGANDNGSAQGAMLEFFRVLLEAKFKPQRTISLVVFSGEEEGLYGSQYVAAEYFRKQYPLRAMLCLDQMGWVNPRHRDEFGIYTDNTDPELTTFVTKLADAYTDLPWVITNEGGRSDSDFHSFTELNFRAAYIGEGVGAPWFDLPYGNDKHTAYDLVEGVNIPHVLQLGRVALGFLVELSFE